jgi:hypothetical protein
MAKDQSDSSLSPGKTINCRGGLQGGAKLPATIVVDPAMDIEPAGQRTVMNAGTIPKTLME